VAGRSIVAVVDRPLSLTKTGRSARFTLLRLTTASV
jgi:hypothetical protein